MTNTLIPPDLKQCQACPNVLGWSFMSCGPMPKPVRCKNVPVCTVHENTPGPDGKQGCMSLCAECLPLFKQRFSEDYATVIALDVQVGCDPSEQ